MAYFLLYFFAFFLPFWQAEKSEKTPPTPALVAESKVCPSLQDSFAETRERALNEARRTLLMQGGTVWVSAHTLTLDAMTQADWLEVFSRAQLSQEQVLAEQWLPAAEQQLPCYQVKLQAVVQAIVVPGTQVLDLGLWMEDQTLQEGQALALKISSSSGGYLTLLNIAADGTVSLLLPNAHHPQPFYLSAGQMTYFPALLKQHDLKLVARVLPGQSQSQELLKAILTQEPLHIQTLDFKQGLFQTYQDFGSGIYQDMQRLLFSQTAGNWAEQTLVYQVSR